MTRQCGLREAETEAVAACSVASRAADLRNGIVRSLPLQLQPQGVHDEDGQGQRGAARCREGARAAGDSDRLSKESPESGCAPQLGDNLGLQRGDAEFIEKFLVSAWLSVEDTLFSQRAQLFRFRDGCDRRRL